MTHLRIEQNNIQENVSSAVIEKLYQLATSGDLDASSNLAGNLYVSATYQEYIDALCKTQQNPDGLFEDLTIVPSKIYIWIKDDAVRQACANSWGDGVGVTEAQAASQTQLYEAFKNNTDLTDATFFKYFTGLDQVSLDAYNRRLGISYVFDGCSNLTTVTLPSNLYILETQMFRNCTSLTSIDLHNITRLPFGAFEGCNVELQNTQNVQHIIGRGTNADYKNGIANTTLSFPNVIDCISPYTFYSPTLASIDFGENLTQLECSRPFSGCSNLSTIIIRAVTPPNLVQSYQYWGSNSMFNDLPSGFKIYVPDASVSTYKAATGWSNWESHIVGLSTLPST